MTAWIFIVLFPVLMGAPVTVRIESQSADQCSKVRALLVSQLADHRSNATVTPCALGVATVLPAEPKP